MITSGIIPRPLAKLPWRLIFLVTAIAMFGLIVLYSAAGGSIHPWAVKQALVFVVFLGIAVGMSWMKESTIKAITFPLYGVTLVMLIGVEALGFVSKGAQRWLDLGPIRLQPSEFMKPAIVLTLARFYELVPAGEIRKWRAIWPALALLGVPAVLILVQPDLGTCIMVVLCGVTVMFLAGLPLVVLRGARGSGRRSPPRSSTASCTAISASASTSSSTPKAIRRAPATISPSRRSRSARAGSGARASSTAARATFNICPRATPTSSSRPWRRNGGWSAACCIILAFALVIRWGMKVSQNASSRFAQLAAAGLSATIFFYVSINLMMVMGLAPVVGVPLPLVSFGGSAVMTVMLCLGLLMALERQQRSTSRLF